MSEETVTNTDNLCIPEDTFEQFQSVYKYEEEELITLSDILSPPSQPVSTGDDTDAIPFDNEVILTSNLDEPQQLVNTDTLAGNGVESTPIIPEPLADQPDTLVQSDNNSIQNGTTESAAKKKRGKKKKTKTNLTQPADFRAEENNFLNETLNNAVESEVTPIPQVTKRGRKRKSDIHNNSSPTNKLSSKSLIDSPAEPELPKRRGRKRKTLDDVPSTQNVDPIIPSQISNSNGPTKKRGQKPKNQQLHPSEVTNPLESPIAKTSNKRNISKKQKCQKELSMAPETYLAGLDNATASVPDDDEGDDLALSELKETLDTPDSNNLDKTDLLAILNSTTEGDTLKDQQPLISNLNGEAEQSISTDNITENQNSVQNPAVNSSTEIQSESLLVEDTSKRPKRRKIKQPIHYDNDSDEDPFANVELSDDEPRKKKGYKDYSDDEYIPGKRGKKGRKGKHDTSSSDSFDSDIDAIEENKVRNKRFSKKSDNTASKSPKKGAKNTEPDVTTIVPNLDQDDDIEVCLQTSVIKANDDTLLNKPSSWNKSSEFENFIAKKTQGTGLKIKKVTAKEPVTTLEIPTLNPNEPKKMVENSTQTNKAVTKAVAVQATKLTELPMKENVALTAKQTEKACEFLKGIVKATSELGELMTQKSEDFIQKKINIQHVTDTFKMDYCIKKSFLLLKLAKHNLTQLEDDLSKQYSDFLKSNNLAHHREKEKTLAPTATAADSDSDCEIVDVQPKPEKPKFNPKTVFLNKELSIKIAKKPTEDKKPKKTEIKIPGTHTVWLNDSIMVKKVKPTQSFLAQDSRNKKPPDSFITEKMVSDFFKIYNRQRALLVCSPLVSKEWLCVNKVETICNYFFVKSDATVASFSNGPLYGNSPNNNSDESKDAMKPGKINLPKSLQTLCIQFFKKHMTLDQPVQINEKIDKTVSKSISIELESLTKLCINVLNNNLTLLEDGKDRKDDLSLSQFDELLDSSHDTNSSGINEMIDKTVAKSNIIKFESLTKLCINVLNNNLTLLEDGKDRKDDLSLSQFDELLDTSHDTNSSEINETIDETVAKSNINEFESLTKLCINVLNNNLTLLEDGKKRKDFFSLSQFDELNTSHDTNNSENVTLTEPLFPLSNGITEHVEPLKCLCLKVVAELFFNAESNGHATNEEKSIISSEIHLDNNHNTCSYVQPKLKNQVKTLHSICVQSVNTCLQSYGKAIKMAQPLYLKQIAVMHIKSLLYRNYSKQLKTLASLCYEAVVKNQFSFDNIMPCEESALTINCVNTLSEEAFLRLEASSLDMQAPAVYSDEEVTNYGDDYHDYEDFGNEASFDDNAQPEENSWVAQLQMQELTSVSMLEKSKSVENRKLKETNNPIDTRIKLEPLDEYSENVPTLPIIKTEPVHHFDEMTVIPESVLTKLERSEHNAPECDPITSENSISYDINSFETFVRSNKMMRAIEYNADETDDIYSQSTARIRRQHQPDSDPENEVGELGLLVPQTFEPINIETAKNTLMESSSDESSSSKKKNISKKKLDKRKLRKTKKDLDPKQNKNAMLTTSKPNEPSKKGYANRNKTVPSETTHEVAILTRRMREKISQEEKKVASSDSDTENMSLKRRKDKKKTGKIDSTKLPDNTNDDEIQCSNVDSTENVMENRESPTGQFSGFSVFDQNEISSYHRYVKYVYDKIIPNETDENETNRSVKDKGENQAVDKSEQNVDDDNRIASPVMNPDEPVELLECEPLMPVFDDKPLNKNKTATDKEKKCVKDRPYTERHGWKCYSVDTKDVKLYSESRIAIEKLPESFVETYFRYQDVTDHCRDDEEVDRLINLQSLNRSATAKDIRKKVTNRAKSDAGDTVCVASDDNSRIESAVSDHYDELMPSDEEADVDDELPPSAPRQASSDNYLAKNSLMDDNESDTENPNTTIGKSDETSHFSKKSKPGPKSKTKIKSENSEDLMLTADKMMNKELTLLHAPVVLDGEVLQGPSKGPNTRRKTKLSKGESSHALSRSKDDSSSEEEKQWVNTKEKLLKRMGHKNYQPGVDDAKRAKIVSEFIQRRSEIFSSKWKGGKRKQSTKKFMEEQKQLKVLSRELFGEANNTGKKTLATTSLFKGRRNIRKVIDKKSLARSTVIANMEEFERKRRLNIKQSRLRELLACDEDVNVLVINDEVCLEYDFDECQPIVSVHPFFTKVMKAHQYEGVKFMWDACFESLQMIESGHGGGGCILAHCMGLGKTLQVLALLHTVLTHPRANMKRVLVCCPLSTVLNWVDEIHKWIGPVTDQIKVFELSKLKKTYERAYQLEDWYNGGGIFIIGYELFRSLSTIDPDLDDVRPTIVNKIRTALLNPGPDIIICDEGHLLKNDCSVLAVAMSRVVTKRRIILTGTPMQNNLREYYCMVDFVKPNLLGTYSEYSNRFENPIMNGQHRDSVTEDIKLMKARTHILHKVLEGCLQRQEASVLYPYLPKKHEYTVFIPLTQCQIDLYKHYLEEYSRLTKQSILKDFHTLQKIWTHPQVLHNFQMKARDQKAIMKVEKLEDDLAREDLAATEDMKPPVTGTWWLQYLEQGSKLDSLESSNKFLAVFRILDECVSLGDKVLIFSTSLFTLDALEYFLRKMNKWALGQEYYRLDGSVPPEVRQKWCREFNAEHNVKTKLFLISTRAGSLGLNMTAANRVIILDTSWNPAHDIQSIFRVYRFGQKKDCYIYRLVALGTMEQKIYERSVTKQAVACRVVDEQLIDRHYNMAELTELYRFDESGSGVAGGVAVGVHDVALLRVARDAPLHAVHEHDSLLRGSSEQGLEEHERAAAWTQFQQEQTHKQIQNKLIPVRSVSQTESKSILKPIKEEKHTSDEIKPNEKRATKANEEYVVPTSEPVRSRPKRGQETKEIKNEQKDKDYVPTTYERVKLKKYPNTYVPKQVNPCNNTKTKLDSLDPANENVVVTKIMNILIKYDYHTSRSRSDMMRLIKDVRKAVATGDLSTLSESDAVTQNIARVLLNNDEPEEIIQPDIQPKVEPTTTGDKRGRPFTIGQGRPQKDRMEVIELDKDTDENSGTSETIPADSTPLNADKNRKVFHMQEPMVQDPSASIVLSDDDEPTETTPKESEKPVEPPKPVAPTEKIPLHTSLLSNKNFIQIVAHTYLKNNSSLDEDAAILAAQYSAFKALNEIKSSGNPLESGPLHDIAVEVLGIDVMKKLNEGLSTEENNDVTDASLHKTTEPEKTQIKVHVRREDLMQDVKKELENHGFRSISERLDCLTTPVGPDQASKHDVVPVGKIKRGPAPVSESILPDDDDVCITSDPIPASSVTEPIPAPKNKTIIIRKTKPGPASKTFIPLVRKTPTVSQPSSQATTPAIPGAKLLIPHQPKVPMMKISKNRIICLEPLQKASNKAPVQSDNTINLDSDDDDVTVPPASDPVPTGLFMRTAQSTVIPISMANPVPATTNAPTLVQIDPQTQLPQSTVLNVDRLSNAQQLSSLPSKNLYRITKEEYEAAVKQRSLRSKQDRGTILDTDTGTKQVTTSVLAKRGDIMKISNTGAIIVLNKTLAQIEEQMAWQQPLLEQVAMNTETDKEKPATTKPTSISLPKTDTSAKHKGYTILKPTSSKNTNMDKGNKATKKTTSEDPRKSSETQKPTPSGGNKRSYSISSSSDSSRPSSPDDPLSILKDVVHIKAPEDNTKPNPAQKPKPNPPSKNSTSNFKQLTYDQAKKVISKTATSNPASNPKPGPGKWKNTDTNITWTTSKPSPVVESLMKSRAMRNTQGAPQSLDSTKDLKTITPSCSKSSKAVSQAKTSVAKPASSTSTVVGVSKNILIGGKTGQLLSTISPSKNTGNSGIRVTSVEKIAATSDKKRSLREPDVDTFAKKKKTEVPKTLKDFNIDDFDDIIELE